MTHSEKDFPKNNSTKFSRLAELISYKEGEFNPADQELTSLLLKELDVNFKLEEVGEAIVGSIQELLHSMEQAKEYTAFTDHLLHLVDVQLELAKFIYYQAIVSARKEFL